MATIVQEFGLSEERAEFSGSSEEDVTYAKSFWQSVQLLPPMESRLVSSTIRQRLRTAPQSSQTVNRLHEASQEPPQLTNFLAKAHALERREQVERLERFAVMRDEDIALLAKHRQTREEKEKLSAGHKGKTRPPDATQIFVQQKDFTAEEEEEEIKQEREEEVKQTLKDIEDFERQKGQQDSGSESD